MKHKQWIRSLICLLLSVMLLSGCSGSKALDCAEQMDKALSGQAGVKSGTLLEAQEWMCAGNSASDWMAMGLALGGVEEAYDAYLNALKAYVEECYADKGCLDAVKATEYHRIALTVLALGADPTHFGKDGNSEDIDLIADGTYNFAGELGKQGLNGWIWALITLDAGGYEVPQDAKYSRETIRNNILAAQEDNGGFGLTAGSADVDMTAMALQALAPYRGNCTKQIQNALTYLAKEMTDSCSFVSYGTENVESTAQVVIALCALQIDPTKDSRFCRGEQTLITGLQRFYLSDGTYTHTLEDPQSDMMASEQALLAQIAFYRLQQGNGRLYDFTA